MLKAIAAVDQNLGIGKNGGIPWDYPNDQKFFKFETYGSQVLFGRKTFENIGVPLPGRKTFVLSRERDSEVLNRKPYLKYTSKEEYYMIDENSFVDTHVCGGESVYNAFFSDLEEVILTRIPEYYNCDTFFPEFRSEFDKVVEFDLNNVLAVQRWTR